MGVKSKKGCPEGRQVKVDERYMRKPQKTQEVGLNLICKEEEVRETKKSHGSRMADKGSGATRKDGVKHIQRRNQSMGLGYGRNDL